MPRRFLAGGARKRRKGSGLKLLHDSRLRRKLKKAEKKKEKARNDPLYVAYITLRSVPVAELFSNAQPRWVLPITSINEDTLLQRMGLPLAERNQIEGLQYVSGAGAQGGVDDGAALTEDQLSSYAIVRLAANPPAEVGFMQRRTAVRLVRPFPLGLRFSGKNMSPQPCWLAGTQHIALNFSDNDLVGVAARVEPSMVQGLAAPPKRADFASTPRNFFQM